jgi:hypothetical protein
MSGHGGRGKAGYVPKVHTNCFIKLIRQIAQAGTKNHGDFWFAKAPLLEELDSLI